jgi:hypothetical protein
MSDETENDIEESEEQATIEVEIPVSDLHGDIIDELAEDGIPVNKYLEANLQRTTESILHDIYQQGRYQDGEGR